MQTLAMLLVIRNEAEMLAVNLAYHRRLGVQHTYVYLDRCTDDSERIARSFDAVTVILRDRQPDEHYMSAYQTKIMDDALQLARADGYTWLLHVDADEFAYGSDRPYVFREVAVRFGADVTRTGSLPRMLSTIPANVEQVILRPKEAVPVRGRTEQPFYETKHYQTRGTLSRSMLNPTTGEIHEIDRWLGHNKGKSIIRTRGDVVASSAHRWRRRDEKPIVSMQRGFHFHFVVTSASAWLSKYRKFAEYPAHWEKGTSVSFPKQAWKEASVQMSASEAEVYFQRWIALPYWRVLLSMVLCRTTRETLLERVLAGAETADDA